MQREFLPPWPVGGAEQEREDLLILEFQKGLADYLVKASEEMMGRGIREPARLHGARTG